MFPVGACRNRETASLALPGLTIEDAECRGGIQDFCERLFKSALFLQVPQRPAHLVAHFGRNWLSRQPV